MAIEKVLFTFIDQPWADQARCEREDPDIFFPNIGESSKPAKKICAECLVCEKCLNWALATHETFGIRGGLTVKERRKIDSIRTQRRNHDLYNRAVVRGTDIAS